MSSLAHVLVHSSQFPDKVRVDLLVSLRTRQMNHKFHYDSVRQAQKWLELHRVYSPFQRDPDTVQIYQSVFEVAAAQGDSPSIHLIGLGCGGGEKDLQLARCLLSRGSTVNYTPSDVSLALALRAYQHGLEILPENCCSPVVCDLASAFGLAEAFASPLGATRLVTFFGMLPNFPPDRVQSILRELVHPKDLLVLSANLAPGPDYEQGVRRVLPLYDNALTREWLIMCLLDLGIEKDDGQIIFRIEACPHQTGLKRIAADFNFERGRSISVGDDVFCFEAGDKIGLFYSYRHTADRVRDMFGSGGFDIVDQRISRTGEEGVFLCRRVGSDRAMSD